ncbi:dynein light chain Tctex-type 5-B-like [Pectinophora gossypiella]|uniref:dynein light chain Tctex-type 5-B-like n=1 Tax=Pectinophora gossypiella TaxID=13191 RepID=UPI00214E3DDC|nr:dynein light chain Tctex-type 5-B-like [Pectinophora gossypiella]
MSDPPPVITPKPKQVRTHQPTYQLNPRKRFDEETVKKILKQVVDHELEEVEYNDKIVSDLSVSLAENIRNAVKEENYDRYRIIVIVTIGQKRQQGMHMYHSFLWDYERDAFASHSFENCHIFALAVVYGIYLD